MSAGVPGLARLLIRLTVDAGRRTDVLGDLTQLHARRRADAGGIRAWLATVTDAGLISLFVFAAHVGAFLAQLAPGAIARDVGLAFRSLRQSPLFAIVGAASIGIGVGVNTALFSVVETALLRPIPGVADPGRAVELGRGQRGTGFDTFSYPEFEEIRAHVGALAEVAAWKTDEVSVSRGGEGRRVIGFEVTPSYFRALGVTPAMGRFFTADEDRGPDAHPVVVLGHSFWRSLGGDPALLGSTLVIDRHPFTVVGIVPEDFRGQVIAFVPDVYVPMTQDPMLHQGRNLLESRRSSWLQLFGRLAPGATLEALNQQLDGVATGLGAAYPDSNKDRTFSAIRLERLPGSARTPVAIFMTALMAMAGLILIVTCANVAGMFLARGATRERGVAIRLALGSGRASLVRSLTVEALLVFTAGGALGVLVARFAVSLLRPDLFPSPVALDFSVSLDGRVLAFSLAITLGTGLLFGLLPALQATRLDLAHALRDGGRTSARTGGLRRAFVGAQVGLSLVLLTASALFLRSLQRAATIDPGFDPSGSYLSTLDLSLEGYTRPQAAVFGAQLLERLRAAPGVEAAALADDLPLDMNRRETDVLPEGWTSPDSERPNLMVEFNVVSDGYFDALRIPVLRGRAFDLADGAAAPPVAVVSREFARSIWPGADALGRHVELDHRSLTVVGVVEDVKNVSITDQPRPFLYAAAAQSSDPGFKVVVRGPGGVERIAPLLRATILGLDRSVSLSPVVSLESYTSLGVLPQRVAAGFATALGALAFLLAGLGIYGVVAYTVSHQTREMGVRLALGATARDVVALVLRGAAALALPGLAVGAVLAVGLGVLLRGLLLGLSPTDPVAILSVAGALFALVLLATAAPARRAARVHPAEALRSE